VTWRLLRTLRRPLPELTASAQDESNQGNPLGG
jgi:hypothetical protein